MYYVWGWRLIESKDQSDDGIRLLQTGNIGEGKFLEKGGKERFISRETFEKLKCKEVFRGYFDFKITGTCGKSVFGTREKAKNDNGSRLYNLSYR